MVKKRLASGEPCEKCAQTEEMLKRRGHWEQIDEVLWAIEGEADSLGARVAARHGVELAPFFVVTDEEGTETVVTSALRLVRQYLVTAARIAAQPAQPAPPVDFTAAEPALASAEPLEIVRFGLERYGERCAIAFSGAEDVVLIDMATCLGLPFSVFTIDTGRLRSETHQYMDDIRRRYGVEIEALLPDDGEVTDLAMRKGPNSFFRDGHWECCAIRKLRPLGRALARYDAWMTGHRRDHASRETLAVVHADATFASVNATLVRLNPLAGWTQTDVVEYIQRHNVPTNPLFESGFARIGCAPCTRARSEAAGGPDRWWWESSGSVPEAETNAPPDLGAGI